MRASAEAAAADQVVQRVELPRAGSHRVQEDVGILDHLEPRIDASQLARIVHGPLESRAELAMRRAVRDDPGAERTRVIKRDFEVRASSVGRLRLRTQYRLDLRAFPKKQH